ncbi:MAG: ribbon-helix-helix domain-containing protein [Pyrobaculum sp.]
MGRKVKTTVYIDEELWQKVKEAAASMGLSVSEYLEKVLTENLIEADLFEVVEGELPPGPIDLGEEVSHLIRQLRDERADRLSRQ